MNKQGQVLVIFVLLIPIFLILIAMVIDIGLLYSTDKHIESSIKESISYGLKNMDDVDIKNKMNTLIFKNISIKDGTDKVLIDIDDRYIYVTVDKIYDGKFKFLFENNIYEIHNSYYGYIDNNKFVIGKE